MNLSIYSAVGDDQGEIGLWIGADKFINMRPHHNSINGLSFLNKQQLLFSTNDGVVKTMDFNSQLVSVKLQADLQLFWHAMLNPNVALLGQQSSIAKLDLRKPEPNIILDGFTNGTKATVSIKTKVFQAFVLYWEKP